MKSLIFYSMIMSTVVLSCKNKDHVDQRSAATGIRAAESTGEYSNYPDRRRQSQQSQGSRLDDKNRRDSTQDEDKQRPTPTDEVDDDTAVEYPKVVFRGDGKLTHYSGTADITQDLSAHVETNRLTQQINYFAATGGSGRRDVDQSIKNSVGPIIYSRPSRTDRFFTSEAAKRALGFTVFGVNVAANNHTDTRRWRNLTFSSPVPVLIMPGPESRYETLANGPILFSANVTTGNKNFLVNYSIMRTAKTASTVKIAIEASIPNDREGELYEALSAPQRLIFTIDTNIKKIIAINSLSFYETDKSNNRMPINIDFELCRLEWKERTETIKECAVRKRD